MARRAVDCSVAAALLAEDDHPGVTELIRALLPSARVDEARGGVALDGDPASVMFCHDIGLNYVSCSPRRVPIARLAAAQQALASK